MPEAIVVVSAHSADFVWRAAGAIATAVERGAEAHVVAISYGERGESGGAPVCTNWVPSSLMKPLIRKSSHSTSVSGWPFQLCGSIEWLSKSTVTSVPESLAPL